MKQIKGFKLLTMTSTVSDHPYDFYGKLTTINFEIEWPPERRKEFADFMRDLKDEYEFFINIEKKKVVKQNED